MDGHRDASGCDERMHRIQDDEDVGTLSRMKSPLAGMGVAQKIATVALTLLAIIALLALLTGRGGSTDSDPSSRFTPATYASDRAGATPSESGAGAARSGSSQASRGDTLATISVDDLPQQARQTVARIDAGGPFPYSRDGIVFSNREHVLPKQARGWYHEYTVKTPGENDRGARRLVKGQDGAIYYSDDHYRTFKRVMR